MPVRNFQNFKIQVYARSRISLILLCGPYTYSLVKGDSMVLNHYGLGSSGASLYENAEGNPR